MSTPIEITREITFTDYACADDCRHEVTIFARPDGKSVAVLNVPWEEMDEPDMLRSLAKCLNAAADELAICTSGIL